MFFDHFFSSLALCSFLDLLVERTALPENLVAAAASEERRFKQSPEEASHLPACPTGLHLLVFPNCKQPWRAHDGSADFILYTCTYDRNSSENTSSV